MYLFYSLLALSTHKNVKCYPAMTKVIGKLWERFASFFGLRVQGDRGVGGTEGLRLGV